MNAGLRTKHSLLSAKSGFATIRGVLNFGVTWLTNI